MITDHFHLKTPVFGWILINNLLLIKRERQGCKCVEMKRSGEDAICHKMAVSIHGHEQRAHSTCILVKKILIAMPAIDSASNNINNS